MIRAALLLFVLLCLWPADASAQSCSYAPSPTLDFGTSIGAPAAHRDFTTTIDVTCTGALIGLLNLRACLSIPAGSGGISIADRRLVSGGNTVQYQIYTDAARSNIWGALGGSSPPFAVDFPGLALGGRTVVVTLYGRVFGPQTSAPVGLYTSQLTPIQSRIATYVLSPAACTAINSAPATVGTITAQLDIDTACTITATPLGFGTVTNLATVSPAASNLSVTCTSGGAYSVALDGGESGNVNARRMTIDAGADVINYQLYRPAGVPNVWGNTTGLTLAGTGTGSPQSLQVNGVVLPAQGPKPTGTYRDTITATVTF